MGRSLSIVAAVLALLAGAARADERQVLDGLKFQTGNITLGDNLAHVALTDHFRFLSPADTETFLVKVWGNPPGAGAGTLGMVMPADVDLLGADGWAIVVTYDASGNVSDDDAATIDYDQLLKDMQRSTRDNNEERKKQGYEPIELVGWAKPPYYDKAAKKLYWAKRLKFGDSAQDTLNYEIRVLGRAGVLDLTVVADIDHLQMVDDRINEILTMVDFNPGNTYAEFKPGIDKAAEYGIAGLIAGGILAKAGFFKFLIGFAKPILIGVLALAAAAGGFLRRLFRRA
jgi:uncharacterized membrane-anchored protein